MEKEIDIKIRSNRATVTTTTDVGVTVKDISLSKLCQILADNAKSTKVIVPPGSRMVYESKDVKTFVFVRPPFVSEIGIDWRYVYREYGDMDDHRPGKDSMYNNDCRVFKIPFPATVIAVAVRERQNGTFTYINMWAWATVNHLVPLKEMDLYWWPFTNVYTDCHVCTGTIPHEYSNLEQVANIPNYIFSGVCNTDLVAGSSRLVLDPIESNPIGRVNNGMDLMIKLDGYNVFPTAFLKKHDNLMSVVDNIVSNLHVG